ncbi:MAG: hypothetical protein FJ224_07760 [Lentisphaerae bacterium]|nr:hypothetical protein [Lentisphaerota bacterium]
MEAQKKKYERPVVTRVRLEDKRVVAMAACNYLLEQPGNGVEGEYVVDGRGNRLLFYDPSL